MPEKEFKLNENINIAAAFFKGLRQLPDIKDHESFYKELGQAMSVPECHKLMAIVEYGKCTE